MSQLKTIPPIILLVLACERKDIAPIVSGAINNL